MEKYCLHRVVGLASGVLSSLVAEVPLALLHDPLQLSREDLRVVVALKAIAVRQHVHDDLCGREPETAPRHERQTEGDATNSSLKLFARLPRLPDRIRSSILL